MEDKSRRYLSKHLVGLEVDEDGDYCNGKYTGCTKTLVEGYVAVTSCNFVRTSSHAKGSSKRFKAGKATRSSIFFSQTNSCLPIPFNGYPFELTSTEKWSCSHSVFGAKKARYSSENQKVSEKRKIDNLNCNANILIRSIRVYTEYGIPEQDDEISETDMRKLKEVTKDKLLDAFNGSMNPKYTEIHYCRFPLPSAHLHDASSAGPAVTHMDKRVISKIRELARSGIYDADSIQAILIDYVYNTLFAHADSDEKPKPDNRKYFPSVKAIRNHVSLTVGGVKNIPGYSQSRKRCSDDSLTPSVTNIIETPVKCNVINGPGADIARNTRFNIGFVAVHAGAGFHSSERWPGYKHLCSNVCRDIADKLKSGMPAGEAVTLAVKMLEDSDMTNAGYGSNLTEDGKVECDASVMDTTPSEDPANQCDSYFGSVACTGRIRNPVQAAYKILSERRRRSKLELGRIPPSFMVSEGAENWSCAHGLEMCFPEDLISESSQKSWQKYHRKLLEKLAHHNSTPGTSSQEQNEEMDQSFDTVGAVVLDMEGNTAAAVSSGGLALKLPGRVGQAAMYGCGCWAEPRAEGKPAVSVTTSGCGEQLISTMLAKKCAENLQQQDQPYQALQDTLVNDFLDSPMLGLDCNKQAGALCLHHIIDETNSTVEVVWGHTTSSMVIGHMSTNDTSPKVELSRLLEDATPGKSVTVGGSWVKVGCAEQIDLKPSTSSDPMASCAILGPNGMLEAHPGNVSGKVGIGETCVAQHGSTWSCVDYQYDVDEDLALMFVSPVQDGLSESDCEVLLSEDFNRKIDREFEKNICERWKKRVSENPRLFNGQKFRIHSVQCSSPSEYNKNFKLIFNLGLTSYRDYMETNWAPEVEKLHQMGMRDFQNSQAYFGEPLGVAAVVITEDSKVVFQWRNSWLAEGANKLDVPGGHPEPIDAADITTEDPQRTVDFSDLNPDKVLHELFYSQVKEVRDELNVPLERIGETRLMGLVRNKLSAGRGVAYFVMRCHLTSEEILRLYSKGGAETDESTNLQFISLQDVMRVRWDQKSLWDQMCPNGKAACTLYSLINSKMPAQSDCPAEEA